MTTTDKVKKSRSQEERIAELIGGQVTRRSGAGWVDKNDVRSEKLLVECKRTDNTKSITIKFLDMHQVEVNGACLGREGSMAIEMDGKDFFVIPDYLMAELIEAAGWK